MVIDHFMFITVRLISHNKRTMSVSHVVYCIYLQYLTCSWDSM